MTLEKWCAGEGGWEIVSPQKERGWMWWHITI